MAVPVVVYSTTICPYCVRAKQLLKQKGVDYEDINLDKRPELRNDVMKRSGRRTVPQIWVGETHVGGFDELWALDRAGKLDSLLQGA
ncbi:glutaredoxin 3 [Simiduia curdlanivorans]|uniref:Glutaredoxin n=1 Tax=Simiduia curdlanivorans TaxID=1492769 RepID=A0ABV8V637_9GAMM|nr:glutaredoxin 3 [Simiduia curdlanivorans]MDN3637410.1 glutaredoxin 3 [Simiduia curdlanivorans]